MLLTIDIGNTNIVLGLWNGRSWLIQWRLRTVHERTSDEYGIYLTALLRERDLIKRVEDIIISSVVPKLTHTFSTVAQHFLDLDPLIVTADTDSGIVVKTDNPAQVGADRIVNAAAAHHLYHCPTIVIDMGTATTFDVVSKNGELLGGVIAPGLQITADALTNRAAKLSQVDLEPPPAVIGRNTIEAIQSGLIFGYVSQIEGLVMRLKAEMHESQVKVVGTGGLMALIYPHTAVVDHLEPWLTLTGLRLIADRNRPR